MGIPQTGFVSTERKFFHYGRKYIPDFIHLSPDLLPDRRFIRLRRPYQLLLAVGIVASLLIYVGGEHNKVWFHTVGIFELVLLLGAIVLSIIARKKEKQAAAAQAADTAGDSKTEETDA